MFSDRIFQVSLLISLIVHGIIFSQNPNLNLSPPLNKKQQKLEISYLRNLQEAKEYQKTTLPEKEPFLKLSSKLAVEKKTPPPFVDKANILKKNVEIISQKSSFTKPAFIKPDMIAIKKKITLPPIDMNKINNSSYISYYQLVRENIRRAAYQNYTSTEIGEIYLSFVISHEGYLKEVRLIEEKSSNNPYLKGTALRSIKDASPFPIFPKELDYPQLSFNVVISFEIE